MNIKKGDNVIMLQGKDRGKQAKAVRVLRVMVGSKRHPVQQTKVIVEGLNTVKRHQRARQQGQVGQILTKERPVDISNVQLVCPKCSKPTRVSRRMAGNVKVRVCKKCNSEI
ncbi:MAG: 50S ribosomal protein L24 [Candidatus Yanofskybacteria bacterium RIFCSPLOWO2_01_FULL_49_25]|uniref:Large ribosomal subunit protein uL24 n=1 Tax=Candidatus Yanofskybacteria bacterium RIFCSPLOWO2_01_FULL_49_25 TaxID=1802701 RepID=A0A1F8GUQ2_9BACT|nr:MAG: 50S ribosomal protein L24 [Candidatus Yanofskybacteria bacterium RIFCSPLOWO2_01_FULL_49_25]